MEKIHFFVSFSSKDLPYVREIMAALDGQGFSYWDYSNLIESIELGSRIDSRLFLEIDKSTHVIAVISSNSMDPTIGKFCIQEVEYALEKKKEKEIDIISVFIDYKNEKPIFLPPYDHFTNNLFFELDNSPEAIVEFTRKLCMHVKKDYFPPIMAHPYLPFWKFFRQEAEQLQQSNKEHVDLMRILGEFNEHFKKESFKRAHFLIDYFIRSCEYLRLNYEPFYPVIVKAVCETSLGLLDEALKSYKIADNIQPENQDVIGGIGSVWFKKGEMGEALNCYNRIIANNSHEDTTNAKINRIIILLATQTAISGDEEQFLFNVDIEKYPDDLKTAILNAQALWLYRNKNYSELEALCNSIIQRNLHDDITLQLLKASNLNRGTKK